MPDHSVYRKSTEALTKHRLRIIESIKPTGLKEWQERVSPLVEAHPEAFKRIKTLDGNDVNVVYREPPASTFFQSRDEEINALYKSRPQPIGPVYEEEVRNRGRELARDVVAEERGRINIEAEPSLTMEQISEVEQQIGAGLIEEVIEVAEGERQLAAKMGEFKV